MNHALKSTAILSLVALAACGDAGLGEPVTTVGDYLSDLPTWDEFSPQLPSENVPAEAARPSEPVTFVRGDEQMSCVETPYSLTQTPERIAIFKPDSEILWLGALLQGSGYEDGIGSLAELPIRERAPLTVFIDLLTAENTVTVDDPTPASIGQAIGSLVETAELNGHDAGSTIFFDQKRTHSLEQASLDLGISARYLGTSVTADLSYDASVEENTLTAYFVQQMYTASIVLPQTPSEVFSDELTAERLQEQVDLGRVGPDNVPTYISSIVYGRMLMVTMSSLRSFEEMEAALSASRAAIGSGEIDVEHRQVLDESHIQVSTVGGNDEGVENLIRTGQLGTYFDATLSLTEARPLSYTVRHLGTNDIATVSETTTYNLKECTSSDRPVTGARYKLQLNRLYVVSDGCDPITAPAPEVYYSFSYTDDSGTHLIASRSASDAKKVEEGDSLYIRSEDYVDMYKDGRGSIEINGWARDSDINTNDSLGTWSGLRYGYGTTNGERYFTRSGAGKCRTRLYLTITRGEDLYD